VTERLLLVAALVVLVVVATVVVRAAVARRTRARLDRALPASVALAEPGAPTVVYFYGAGCPTCPSQRTQLDRLAERVAPLNLVPVDAAADAALAAWAGVLTVPSTALVDRAHRLRRVNHGFRSADELAEQLAAFA